MRTARLLAAIASSTLLAAAAHAQSAPPQQLDMEGAVKLALAQAPGLLAVHAQQAAALAQAKSVRGRLLPSLYVSDEQQHYDSPFNIAFGPATFTARNINTNVFVAGADQPLLGLLHLVQDHAALSDVADAATEQSQGVASTIREQIESAYLRMFEARGMIDVARASEAQLGEQRNLAEARLRAGVVTNADVLRIATAQANAQLQEVQAQSQADATEQALLVTLGYGPDAQVSFVAPVVDADAAPAPETFAEVQRQAETHRHEVAAAKLQQSAAAHQSKSALYKLLPAADLEANYTHIHGEILAPENSAFIGVKVSWPIFTWGADWYAYQAAKANADAAANAADDKSRSARIDAAQRLAQLRATASAVNLAKTAIASAQEAYRVTNAQVKAGVATSTSDLLDAQSALTQAKLQLTRAQYERAIAKVALQRATHG